MKTWQKIALWAAGIFVFGVSAANLFFMLADRRAASPAAPSPKPLPAPKTADWKRYDFPEAGISALFPAPPEMKTETASAPGDPDETVEAPKYRMHASLGASDYKIVASVVPAGMKIDLDSVRALVNPGRGSEILDRKTVAVNGAKAYDFTVKTAVGDYFRARTLLMDGMYVQAVASGPFDALKARETENFLGSVMRLKH